MPPQMGCSQYLLDRARWDADAARDVLRQWVIDMLGSPDGVLVLDETGFGRIGDESTNIGLGCATVGSSKPG